MPCHCVQNVEAYQYAVIARDFVKMGRRSPGGQRAKQTSSGDPLEKGKVVIAIVSATKGMGNEFYE